MDLRPARLHQIVDLLSAHGGVRTRDLASELGVSLATARRDLRDLAARGLINRTHGGAVALAASSDSEAPHAVKARRMRPEKQRIAAFAASQIADGSTIVLDSGTTALALAEQLVGRPITVIALDLPCAAVLSAEEGVVVWCPGGRVRNGLYSLVGPWIEDILRTLAVDTFFMTADAVDASGVSNSTVEEAKIKQLAMQAARQTVLLTDSTKFGRPAFARVCQLTEITALVTDRAGRTLVPELKADELRVEFV